VKVKNPSPVITIDGAGGTGKGVVTHRLAKILGWHLLDSGVLYRVLGYAAIKHNISIEDETALLRLAEHLDVKFISAATCDPPQIVYENLDVTQLIRTETMGNTASRVGVFPLVRAALLNRLRAFQEPPGLVTDGRDMGTVVFPNAEYKFFLTASVDTRARRRLKQLKQIGIHANLGDLILELKLRDQRDQERAVAPLKPAADALVIDTDQLTVDQVVECIMDVIKLG
jgi:cytidylate kinase